MSVFSVHPTWRSVAIVSAVVFVYASVLSRLSQTWWVDENYSHGLLIPFVIGYMLWSERDRLRQTQIKPSTLWGGSAVLLALFALWAGVAGAELYVQRISLVLLIVGVVLYFWGLQFLRLLWFPLGLLLLAIPIPAIIFNKIAFPLQLFASSCAVWSMRLFNIPVLRQGNVIELMPLNSLETKKLEVVEACSGIRSLMTLVTLAVVLAYFTRPRSPMASADDRAGSHALSSLKSWGLWRSILIVLSAVPIAILTNALRVSGTGVLAHYYGTKIADSFFHSFSGWLIYIVAFLLLILFGWSLDKLASLFSRGTASERTGSKTEVRTTPIASVPRIPQPEGTD